MSFGYTINSVQKQRKKVIPRPKNNLDILKDPPKGFSMPPEAVAIGKGDDTFEISLPKFKLSNRGII